MVPQKIKQIINKLINSNKSRRALNKTNIDVETACLKKLFIIHKETRNDKNKHQRTIHQRNSGSRITHGN